MASGPFDPKKAALVFIDMQNDIVHGGMTLAPSREQLLAGSREVLQAARDGRVPVIFVKVERKPDLSDGFKPPLGAAGFNPAKTLIEGTRGAQIVDEIKPLPSEHVVIKRRVSAFYSTNMEAILRSLGVEVLLLGGVATNMGVEVTALDARDRDYGLVLLKDCCASYAQDLHDWSMTRVFPRMGLVMTAKEASAILRGA